MSGQPATSGTTEPRVLLVDADKTHDVFDVLEVTEARARVRSAFLFEIGEQLKLRLAHEGTVFETIARVRAHVGDGPDTVTELELGERTTVK